MGLDGGDESGGRVRVDESEVRGGRVGWGSMGGMKVGVG